MLKLSRLLIFGFVFTAPIPDTIRPQVVALPSTLITRHPIDGVNGFVFDESQYCRPFLQTRNPQVVRVVNWVRVPTAAGVEERRWGCSGVVVGPRAVLTAKHCARDTDGDLVGGFVITADGQSFNIELRIPDAKEDILLLRVDRPLPVKPVKVANKASIALTLAGYGCQSSSPLPLQRSAIALYTVDSIVFLAGCICHGDSGGPIFDDDGRLIGLMFWTDNDGKNGRGVMVQDFMRQHLSAVTSR